MIRVWSERLALWALLGKRAGIMMELLMFKFDHGKDGNGVFFDPNLYRHLDTNLVYFSCSGSPHIIDPDNDMRKGICSHKYQQRMAGKILKFWKSHEALVYEFLMEP